MTTYTPGQVLTLTSGRTWKVRNVGHSDDGHIVVGLVNPENPNHGTAFRAEVLDALIVRDLGPTETLISLLAADLAEHPAFFPGSGNPARPLAAVLVRKGWKR